MTTENCAYCGRTGKDPNTGALSGYKPCPVCKGLGERTIDAPEDRLKNCEYCRGTGKDPNTGMLSGYKPCSICSGWGVLARELIVSSKARKTVPLTISEREDLVKRLAVDLKHFHVAADYFEEAKSCFGYGFMRAATIIAISALESCLKTDYLGIKGEEYDGKLSNLINRYFSGDLNRLPKQYQDFTNTYVKIRNSFTHPEEFDYSETIVFNVLGTIAELMKAIEKHY